MALNWYIKEGRFYLESTSAGTFSLNGLSGSIEINENLRCLWKDAQQINDLEFVLPGNIHWKWIVQEAEDYLD